MTAQEFFLHPEDQITDSPEILREAQWEWFMDATQDLRNDAILQEKIHQPGIELTIPSEGFETFVEILSNLPEDSRTEEDHLIVARAFALASWAHQFQIRKSGEWYIHHPLWVAQEALKNHRVPAYAVAAYLMHDVLEDTGKNDYPIDKIDKADLERIFPEHRTEQIYNIVDGMSEITGLTDPYQAFEKLYKASVENPLVILGKFYDSMHNLRTISGHKEMSKQLEKADYALMAIVPMAKLMGFRREARIIGDMAFSISEILRNGGDRRIRILQELILNEYTDEKIQELKQFFTPIIDNKKVKQHMRISPPGMYELTTIHARNSGKRSLPESSDCWYNIEMAVPRKNSKNEENFVEYTDQFIKKLRSKFPEIVHFPPVVGFTAAAEKEISQQARNGVEYKVIYTFANGTSRELKITFYPEILYHQRTTPLSVKDSTELPIEHGTYSVGLDREESHRFQLPYHPEFIRRIPHGYARSYAEDALVVIQKFAETIESKHEGWRVFLDQLQLAQPDGIKVIGDNGKVQKEVSVPEGSTVLDYAMIWLPDTWWRIHEDSIFVNGKKCKSLREILPPGAVIRFKDFSDRSESGNKVEPYWLSAISTTSQKRNEIILKLKEKESYLRRIQSDKIISFMTQLKEEGRVRVLQDISQNVGPFRFEYLLRYCEKNKNPHHIDKETFLRDVAYGDVSDELIKVVADAAADYWHQLDIVTLRVIDDPKNPGLVKNFLVRLKEENISYITHADWSGFLSESVAVLPYWFDQYDPNYPRLEKVLKEFNLLNAWDKGIDRKHPNIPVVNS